MRWKPAGARSTISSRVCARAFIARRCLVTTPRHRQLKRAFDQLYPEKDLQERHINITSLLARHGRYVIDWIFNAINLESTEHQIVYL